jgi:uncharacterized membrane protein
MCAQLGISCAMFWLVGNAYLWALSLSAQKPNQSDCEVRSGFVSMLESLSVQESTQMDWTGIAVAMLGVLAITAGMLAVILRFTERPRETLVRKHSADDFDFPVIHARHE